MKSEHSTKLLEKKTLWGQNINTKKRGSRFN
jgi:hypothetical protein